MKELIGVIGLYLPENGEIDEANFARTAQESYDEAVSVLEEHAKELSRRRARKMILCITVNARMIEEVDK